MFKKLSEIVTEYCLKLNT